MASASSEEDEEDPTLIEPPTLLPEDAERPPLEALPDVLINWSAPFHGHWTNAMKPGKTIIEIEGNLVRWKSGNITTLEPTRPREVTMLKDGQSHSARIDRSGMRIVWDNGHVWVRHAITEGRRVKCTVCYGIGIRNPYALTGDQHKCQYCFGTGRRSACH
mmetsp:Transcript_107896/g.300878  ORF Transcript_107896/g.300878 Transcript_107896/m.300878 type:complete len:161 (-) Transcript_107896:114-596(-)